MLKKVFLMLSMCVVLGMGISALAAPAGCIEECMSVNYNTYEECARFCRSVPY